MFTNRFINSLTKSMFESGTTIGSVQVGLGKTCPTSREAIIDDVGELEVSETANVGYARITCSSWTVEPDSEETPTMVVAKLLVGSWWQNTGEASWERVRCIFGADTTGLIFVFPIDLTLEAGKIAGISDDPDENHLVMRWRRKDA